MRKAVRFTLALLVLAAALPATATAPVPPTLIGPVGTIVANPPSFSWTESPGATSYELFVQNTTGVFIDAIELPSICAGGVCTTPLPVGPGCIGGCNAAGPLDYGGTYSWFVRASNDTGTSDWSAGAVITLSGLPEAASPSGSIGTAMPTFSWYTSSAPPYRIVATPAGGAPIGVDVTLADSSMCTSPQGRNVLMYCQYAPGVALIAGATYTWTVQNSFGTSAPTTFSVPFFDPQSPPLTPTILSPFENEGVGASPTFTWTASSGATSYYLLVENVAGVAFGGIVSAADAGCATTTPCTYTPSESLTNQTRYVAFVNASNTAGTSAWSAGRTFVVTLGLPPTLVGPAGSVGTTPTFSWTSALPPPYQILAQNTAGVALYDTVSTGCALSGSTYQCSYTPSTPLASGTYNWFVSNAAGWSAPLVISVFDSITIPATPAPLAPTGFMAVGDGHYYWAPVGGATQYDLLVQNTAGVAGQATFDASVICPGGCEAIASFSLTPGLTYNWFVRSRNAAGASPWSAPVPITITTGGYPPAPPTPLSPTGAVSTTPFFIWSSVPGATKYEVLVQNMSGVAGDMPVDPVLANCNATTCSIPANFVLPSATSFSWFVRVVTPDGLSAWGGPLAIHTP